MLLLRLSPNYVHTKGIQRRRKGLDECFLILGGMTNENIPFFGPER
jgi:hypothetical protein